MDEILAGLSLPERQAVGLVKLLLDYYNRGEGTGLLAGKARYSVLQERLRLAAYASATLRAFWSRLCRTLLLPPHPAGEDTGLLLFIGPQDAEHEARVLRELTDNAAAIVTIAREWHRTEREAARIERGAHDGDE